MKPFFLASVASAAIMAFSADSMAQVVVSSRPWRGRRFPGEVVLPELCSPLQLLCRDAYAARGYVGYGNNDFPSTEDPTAVHRTDGHGGT